MGRIISILKEEKILKPKDTVKDLELYRPKPSKNYPSGYKGRIGIFEVLSVSDAIKNLIHQKASSVEITKGIEVGDTIVTSGLLFLKEGAKLSYSTVK